MQQTIIVLIFYACHVPNSIFMTLPILVKRLQLLGERGVSVFAILRPLGRFALACKMSLYRSRIRRRSGESRSKILRASLQ